MEKLLRPFLLLALCACHAAGAATALARQPRGADAVAPALNIVGASAGGIKLNSNSSNFSFPFTVEATKDAVADVRVSVAPFTGPDGALAEARCEINNKPCGDGPVAVPALDSIQVKVTAALPLEGSYTSAITLTYGGRRETTVVTVARARVAVPVEVLGVDTVSDVPIFSSGAKTLLLTLSGNPGAESFQLQPPVPVSLALEGANKVRLQAPLGTVTVTDENGQKVTGTFRLKSGETRRYRMTIEGLSDAGQYTGTLRVSALDAQPVDRPITVVVKSPALCAMLLIGVGVLVGYLLRRYGTRDRPRLLQQRRLLVLSSEVDTLEREVGQLNEEEKGVFVLVRRWVDDLYEDVQAGLAVGADAAVKLLDEKLTLIPAWVNMRRRVEAVRPPELAEPFRTKLDAVRNFLRDKQPAQGALKQAQDVLAALPAEINAAVRDDLNRRLNDFHGEVEKFRQAATATEILDAIREKIEPAVGRAEAEVTSGRFDLARAAFDEARAEYARLLAESLRANLEAADAPPGFNQEQWRALGSEVAMRLEQVAGAADPEAAIAAYRAAYASYLQKLTAALREVVAGRLRSINLQAETFTPQDLQKHTDGLNGIIRQLDGVARRLKAGELTEAEEGYRQARAALASVVGALAAGGTQMGGSESAAPADAIPVGAIPGPAGELPTVSVLARQPRARPTVESLTKRLRLADFAVTFVIFLIAVALGLYLLWINNPTWGGWGDWLTAVLWGLGMHQVAGAPLDVSGLRERLMSPPAAP